MQQSRMTWWTALFEFSINLTTLELIVGIPTFNNDTLINLYKPVILYGKHCIYINKKKNNTISVYEFLLELKQEMVAKETY